MSLAAPLARRKPRTRGSAGLRSGNPRVSDRVATGCQGLAAPGPGSRSDPGRRRLCLAPLRVGLQGLKFESNDLFARIEQEEAQRRASLRVRDAFSSASALTRMVLRSGRLSETEIEKRLEACVGVGFDDYQTGLLREIGTQAAQKLKAIGLPEPSRAHCHLDFDRKQFNVDVGWCQLAEVDSLNRCSVATRRELARLIGKARLPILWADDLYRYYYGIMEVLPARYPEGRSLAPDFLEKAWEHAVEVCDSEEVENEDGSCEILLHGIGVRIEFEQLVRRHWAAVREREREGRLSARIDRAWQKRLEVLRQLVKIQPRSANYGTLTAEDSRPIEEGFVMVMGPAGRRVCDHYFEISNDGNGEVPGGILPMEEPDALYEGLFWLKATEGVMTLFNQRLVS